MHLVRPANASDCQEVYDLMHGLAVYGKLLDTFQATPESVHDGLFGESPAAEALVAEVDGKIVAFAIFFHNYSTFLSRQGLYLEDLYVAESHRGKGIGTSLLHGLAKIARDRDCGRMEWGVLDWNEPAIRFYESLGANVLPEWRLARFDRGGIEKFCDSR